MSLLSKSLFIYSLIDPTFCVHTRYEHLYELRINRIIALTNIYVNSAFRLRQILWNLKYFANKITNIIDIIVFKKLLHRLWG